MSDAFGLNETVSVESDTNNAGDSDAGDDAGDVTPDYEANETTDYYLAFGDTKAATDTIAEDSGITLPNVNTYENDLSDLPRLLGEHSEAHPQAKLWLAYALAKSSFGDRQASENPKMLGAGLDTSGDSEAYPKPLPNDPEAEQFRYADVYRSLPTIETEGLKPGEREKFAEMDVEPDTLGFREEEGPHIPVIGGERLPIAAASDEDVQDAIDLLTELPDEPSTADPIEGDSDEGDDTSDASGDDDGETVFCLRESSDGTPCRKEVDSPDEACNWHDAGDPRLTDYEEGGDTDEASDEDVQEAVEDDADEASQDTDANNGGEMPEAVQTLLAHDEECATIEDAKQKAKEHGLV